MYGIYLKKEKPEKKEEVGDRPAKLNEKKSERDLEGQKKSKQYIFLLEKQHDNFVAAVRKWEMLAVTKVKVSGSEKKGNMQEHVRHFLHKTCT